MMALVRPRLNDRSLFLSRHAFSEGYGVRISPTRLLLVVCGPAIMAKDVFIVVRIVAMPRVSDEANALQWLFASVTHHIVLPNDQPLRLAPGIFR
jgi:hypothetical protein